MHADKKSGRQVARHSDRQVDRQTDRLTDSGFIYKERETILNRQVHRDENRNTHTYTDTDTQTVEEEVIIMYAETYNDIEADGAFGRGLDRETDAFVRLTPAAHSLSLRRRPSIQLSTGLGTVSLYSMQRSQLRGQRTETHRLVILILTFTCITGELLNRLEACCV